MDNKEYAKQKAALTRAINSKNPEKVKAVCKAVVAVWNQPGNYWPDDWARWQRALDDAFPNGPWTDIKDLA
jgi:hypothetical protein